MPARKPNRSPESMARNAAYSQAWQKEHYDRIVINAPRGRKEIYKAAAERRGQSLNSLVLQLLDAASAE